MAVNAFRFFTASAVALIIWFVVTSENEGPAHNRRAPAMNFPSSCTAEGKVALTFDEGPGQGTATAATTLNNHGVKATFHIVVKYLNNAGFVSNLKWLYESGHIIGMRFRTEVTDLRMFSDKQIREMVITDAKEIQKVLGVTPKFIRLPYDGVDSRVVKVIEALGFVISEWSIDAMDYKLDRENAVSSIAAVYNGVLSKVGRGKGSYIALHHDLYTIYNDPAIIIEVLNVIKNSGFTPVTLDDCLGESGPYMDSAKSKVISDAPSMISAAESLTVPFWTVVASIVTSLFILV